MKLFRHRSSCVTALIAALVATAGLAEPAQPHASGETATAFALPAVAKGLNDPPPIQPAPFSLPASPVVAGSNVGYVPGAAEVNSFGQYTYSIPLDVPVGPAGMQPGLSLDYSSGSGNGIVGMGWSVDGAMSAITRCGEIFAAEGRQTGVKFLANPVGGNEADRFCLDGLKLNAISGTYGASGTEYRTENDIFARIVSYDATSLGPASFKVWSKNGILSEYEAQLAPRNDVNVNGVAAMTEVRLMWLLRRQTDRSGNVVAYEYYVDITPDDPTRGTVGNGIEVAPKRISYSTVDGATRRRYVDFEYRNCPETASCRRGDQSFAWVSGVRIESRRLLSAIKMYGPRPTTTNLLWSYELDYEDGAVTKRKRLTSVRRKGYLGGTSWKKQFTWSENVANFDADVTIETNVPPAVASQTFCVGWSGGDCVDVPIPHWFGTTQAADFNGDFAEDLVYAYPGEDWHTQSQHYIRLSKVGATGKNPLADKHALNGLGGYNDRRNVQRSRPVDLDGDNRLELYSAGQDNPSTSGWIEFDKLYYWEHEDQTLYSGNSRQIWGDGFSFFNEFGEDIVTFVDANGDGRSDALRQAGAGCCGGRLYMNIDGKRLENFDEGRSIPTDDSVYTCQTVPVDVDGDGRTDFLSGIGENDDGCLYEEFKTILVKTSDDGELKETVDEEGRYPVPPSPTDIQHVGVLWDGQAEDLAFGDFNGDGLEDAALVYWTANTSLGSDLTSPSKNYPHLDVRWNTGNGFGPPVEIAQLPVWPSVWKKRDKGLRIADMDRDGRDDFVLFHETSSSSPWGSNYGGITIIHATGARTDLPDRASPELAHLDDSGGPLIYLDWRYARLGDFNGDGRVDIFTYLHDAADNRRFKVWENFQDSSTIGDVNSDLLIEIKDEGTNWPREQIFYHWAWSNWPAESFRCQTAMYPMHCVTPGMPVVQYTASQGHVVDPAAPNAASNKRWLEYSYEDPQRDLRGRGFLGFGLTRVWDETRAAETLTHYGREFVGGKWYKRLPTRVRTAVVIDPGDRREKPGQPAPETFARVSETIYKNEIKALNGGKSYVEREVSFISEEWEEKVKVDWNSLSAANTSGCHIWGVDESAATMSDDPPIHIEGESTYYDDNYGNLKTTTRKVRDGTQESTASTYENRDTGTDWIVGLLRSRTITRAEHDGTPAAVTRSTSFHYDSAGRLDATYREHSGNLGAVPAAKRSIAATETLEYTANGSLEAQTSTAYDGDVQRSRHIRIEHGIPYTGAPDEKIFPTQIWSPDPPVLAHRPTRWMATHPGFGKIVASMDALGNQSVSTFDDFGRPVKLTPSVGKPVNVQYAGRPDSAGGTNGTIATVIQETGWFGSPINQRAERHVDAVGRTVRETIRGFDGGDVRRDMRYDKSGRLNLVGRPYTGAAMTDFTLTTFDGLDRPLEESDAAGKLVRSYDYTFFTTKITDGAGNLTVTERDKDGRMVQSTNHPGGQPAVRTHYEYAPFDLLERITDEAGNVVVGEYDTLGRRTRATHPDSGDEKSVFNGFGDLTRTVHVDSGQTVDYVYDELGRLATETSVGDGITTYVWDSAPNGIGQLAATTSPSGVTTAHRYDARGRPAGVDYVVGGGTYSVDVTYDATYGRLQQTLYPAVPGRTRFTTESRYNIYGYLRDVRDVSGAPNNSGKTWWEVKMRNADLALTEGLFGNGVTTKRSYDPERGRLTGISATGPAGGGPAPALLDLAYTYFDNDLVKTRSETVAARYEGFQYDGARRLRYWTLQNGAIALPKRWEYRYDAIGNLTDYLSVSTFNGVTTPIESYEYGNGGAKPHALMRRKNGSGMLVESYGYDTKGRYTNDQERDLTYTPLDLPKTVDNVVTGEHWAFSYDAFGKRIRKQSGAGATTVYVPGLYEKRIPAAGASTHVFYVSSDDGASVQVSYLEGGASTPTYQIGDALGSIGLVTRADGTVDPAGRQYFDPWGRRTNTGGAPVSAGTPGVTRGFTEMEHDDDLGFVNFKGRLYNPMLRRFLTPDPVVSNPMFGQAWNPYSYVLNSPLNLVDPSGLQTASNCVVASCATGRPDASGACLACTPATPQQVAKAPVAKPPQANRRPSVSSEGSFTGPVASDAPSAAEIAAAGEAADAQALADKPFRSPSFGERMLIGVMEGVSAMLGADTATGDRAEQRQAQVAAFDENPNSTPQEAANLPTRVCPTCDVVVNTAANVAPGKLIGMIGRELKMARPVAQAFGSAAEGGAEAGLKAAETTFGKRLMKMIQGVNPSNCRINCWRISESVENALATGAETANTVGPGRSSFGPATFAAAHEGAQLGLDALALNSRLGSLPNGARGFVTIAWPVGGRVKNHILNFVRDGGRTYFVDGQSRRVFGTLGQAADGMTYGFTITN